MIRKAILVYPKDNGFLSPLKGPKNDINNWKEYLNSPLGGSWSDSEIEILNISNSAELHHYLAEEIQEEYEYIFFAFSGHGGFDTTTDEHQSPMSLSPMGDFIYCSSYSSLYLSEICELLKSITKKALIFVDCCRSKVPNAPRFYDYTTTIQGNDLLSPFQQEKHEILQLSESVQRKKIKLDEFKILLEGSTHKNLLLESKKINFEDAKKKWWDRMPQGEGITIIHSCSQDEFAYECEIDGQVVGLFSYLYINTSCELELKDCLTFDEAFDASESKPNEFIQSSGRSEKQNPQNDNKGLNFPFAVCPQKMEGFLEKMDEDCFQKIERNIFTYNSAKALFENFQMIPGTNQSYVIHKMDTLSNTIKYAHVYAKPKGKGGQLYSIRVDGKGHDGSSGYKMPRKHQEHFRKLGFTVPEKGILECRLHNLNIEDFSLEIMIKDSCLEALLDGPASKEQQPLV